MKDGSRPKNKRNLFHCPDQVFVGHNLAIALPSKQIKERFLDYEKIDSPEPVGVQI